MMFGGRRENRNEAFLCHSLVPHIFMAAMMWKIKGGNTADFHIRDYRIISNKDYQDFRKEVIKPLRQKGYKGVQSLCETCTPLCLMVRCPKIS